MSDPSVVVTGASTGIGREAALHLDARGFAVFAGVRRGEDGERLAADASPRLTPVLLDVTDAASLESAAKAVAVARGEAGLGGLVNNAGIGVGGPLEFLDLSQLRRQLEVNVVGPVAVVQAFLPLLRRARGRIVNVGSVAGYNAAPFLGPYAASKHALEGLSDSLRRELRSSGIEVALIEPGSVETPIWDKARSDVERMRAELTPPARELYGSAIVAVGRYVDKTASRAIPASRVAEAIHHALTAARPRTRYRVGPDAKLIRVLTRVLPGRALDALIARLVGLPGRPR